MKKEIIAGAMLVLILALSLVNTCAIGYLCDDISASITRAGELAQEGDWDGSEAAIGEAIGLWERCEGYTHVVLRHTDIETLSDDFYELLEHIYSQDVGGVRGAVELVNGHLTGIKDMEKLRFGSIF